tara:strand:+ start:317 stop:472 length:156 start_codon:yes stop_codon:yes gene_type:complete
LQKRKRKMKMVEKRKKKKKMKKLHPRVGRDWRIDSRAEGGIRIGKGKGGGD